MAAKELTHRADELKGLGWSREDVSRYVELWEYRQRWGAINLEREDRQFLRKAESILPEITKAKSSVKKPIKEKSYYRWLSFYLSEMNKAESGFDIPKGSRGLWPILLEEELRVLDYYEPVLGLPDTLKAKLLKPFREELVQGAISSNKLGIKLFEFDFFASIDSLKEDFAKNWKPLRDEDFHKNFDYPVISSKSVEIFRKGVREQILPMIKDNFPSLAESEKPFPPEDWSSKSISLAKKEDS
tara:strand:+ start:740 stop:1468 length:729 start_codon:yes stop_codon:yes gene_type:complete